MKKFLYYFILVMCVQYEVYSVEENSSIDSKIGLEKISTGSKKGKSYAIVVGVSVYKDKKFNPLPTVKNDANEIYKYLSSKGDFDEVLEITDSNATKKNIDKKLDKIINQLKGEDTFLFYFSGHGFSGDKGKSFLMVQDTDANNKSDTSLKEEDIRAKLTKRQDILSKETKEQSPIKAILIYDACRTKDSELFNDKLFDKLNSNIAVLYSTEVGTVSQSGKTEKFELEIKELRNNDKKAIVESNFQKEQENNNEKTKILAIKENSVWLLYGKNTKGKFEEIPLKPEDELVKHLDNEKSQTESSEKDSKTITEEELAHKAALKLGYSPTSLFTKFLLEALKAEKTECATDKGKAEFLSDTNGDRILTLGEIGDYIQARTKTCTVAGQMPEPKYGDHRYLQLVSMDRYPPARIEYPVKSSLVFGWGLWDYGDDSKLYQKNSRKAEYSFKSAGLLTFAVLSATTARTYLDNWNYRKKRDVYIHSFMYPAQPIGIDTFTINYLMLARKESDMQKAGTRYNTSATALGILYALNITASYLVPYIFQNFKIQPINVDNSKAAGVSLNFDYRESRQIYTIGQIDRQTEVSFSYQF